MNVLLWLPLLVSAVLAAPPVYVDHSKVKGSFATMDEIEGALRKPGSSRIVNGNVATPGQFPYQAAIYADSAWFCGGSIISKRWILTTARCTRGAYTFFVYLGVHSLSTANTGTDIHITGDRVSHSGYNPNTFYNDIALIYLIKDITFTNYIQPILLASGSATYVGITARVSGWGKTSDASTVATDTLNYVDVPVISNAECAATYGSNVVSTTLCTSGAGGKSICNGDTGGPLVDLWPRRQIGIASFVSSGGCSSGAPAGFARVSSFDRWIAANTGITI